MMGLKVRKSLALVFVKQLKYISGVCHITSELQYITINKLFLLVLKLWIRGNAFPLKGLLYCIFISPYISVKLKLKLKNNEKGRVQFKFKLLSHYTSVAVCGWIIHYKVLIYKIIVLGNSPDEYLRSSQASTVVMLQDLCYLKLWKHSK